MKIFEAATFTDFISSQIESMPRGELKRIADFSAIHTTTLSQAVKGQRPFSLEQVAKIAEYLGLNELETRYALSLLQMERAGTAQLKKIFAAELAQLKNQSHDLVHIIKKDKVLTPDQKAVFYSDWFYAAIAVLCSIEGYQNITALSEKLNISRQKTAEVVDFLVRTGICIESKNKILPGTKSTHLESRSPLINRHHGNWRVRAMERHPSLEIETELAYSSPMSLSENDAKKIREVLAAAVKKVGEIRDPSPCEKAYCLNIDWFKI